MLLSVIPSISLASKKRRKRSRESKDSNMKKFNSAKSNNIVIQEWKYRV